MNPCWKRIIILHFKEDLKLICPNERKHSYQQASDAAAYALLLSLSELFSYVGTG